MRRPGSAVRTNRPACGPAVTIAALSPEVALPDPGPRLADRVSSRSCGPSAALDRVDNVAGRDAELVDQLVGLTAARDVADGEPLDDRVGGRQRFAHRVAQPAGRIVVLDGD